MAQKSITETRAAAPIQVNYIHHFIDLIGKRETAQKRQLGRHPRIPFTSHQLAVLEEKFQQSPYLSSEEVTRISQNLQLADIRVTVKTFTSTGAFFYFLIFCR